MRCHQCKSFLLPRHALCALRGIATVTRPSVPNSNIGHILPRFRNIAGFLRTATPSLFHPNFRGVPLGLDCRCEDPKLVIRVINFELVQPICPRYVNVTDGQMGGQMDGRTTYDSNTTLALRASRGKHD